MKVFSFRVEDKNEKLIEKLKIMAIKQGKDLQDLMNEILEDYFNKTKKD